jgi:hypothetical protein
MVPSRAEPEVARASGGRAAPWGLALCLLALPTLVLGQSLGDVARKERDRREKAGKTGVATRTLSEADLATTKGQLANDPGAADPAAAEEEGESPRRSEAARSSVAAEPSTAPSQEAYWRERAGQARSRVAAADRRYNTLQRMIQYGQPLMYDKNGRRVIYSVHTMKSRADEAEAELRAAEKALEELADEARRAGALPGWLRD